MKARKVFAFACLLLTVVLQSSAFSQEPGGMNEILSMPGPEHEQFHRFAGIWELNITMYPPDGRVVSAVVIDTTTLIHEGRFVRFHSWINYDGTPFESEEFLGFNRVTEKYTYVRIQSMNNGFEFAEGSYEETTNTFTLIKKEYTPGPDDKAIEVQYTMTWDFEGENMYKFSVIYPDVTGKLFPLIETLAVRIE